MPPTAAYDTIAGWYEHELHWPLSRLLHMFTDAGLLLDKFTEGGAPTPTVLAAPTSPSGSPR